MSKKTSKQFLKKQFPKLLSSNIKPSTYYPNHNKLSLQERAEKIKKIFVLKFIRKGEGKMKKKLLLSNKT